MAIIINFAGQSIVRPGSYTNLTVAPGATAQPALGVVALIGEADEGIPFASEKGLDSVSFGPDEFGAIQDKFGSGELVDGAKLAISPSNDPSIRGGAQELLVLQTNAATKATANLPSSYGSVADKKAGAKGNKISIAIDALSAQRVITINHMAKGVIEVSDALGGNTVMTITCTDGLATTATMTIDGKKLTTAKDSVADLDISFTGLNTVGQLVDMISQMAGYTATVASQQMAVLPLAALDHVTAANIKTAFAVKKDAYEVAQFFAQSALVDFTQVTKAGLPSVMARTFFAGGAKGATSQAAIQACFDALLKRRVNFIIPLFSRDATADIADGLTEATSNYTIDSIHAALRSHANTGSTVKGRKERQCFGGYKGSFANAKEKSAALAAGRVQLCFQDVDVQDATGALVTKQPHMQAVLSAGMKASAAPGLSNTYKFGNCSGISHTDFDPETMADEAIKANLAFMEKAPGGGFRFVLDNSTYASDKDAWFWNRPSVIYASDIAAYSIRLNTENFIGVRNSDLSKESIENLLVGVFDNLRAAGIIVADSNTGGRGFKDLNVSLEGSIIRISVTLALVENYEFVLTDIKVQRAA